MRRDTKKGGHTKGEMENVGKKKNYLAKINKKIIYIKKYIMPTFFKFSRVKHYIEFINNYFPTKID